MSTQPLTYEGILKLFEETREQIAALVVADIPEVKAGTWNFRDLYAGGV